MPWKYDWGVRPRPSVFRAAPFSTIFQLKDILSERIAARSARQGLLEEPWKASIVGAIRVPGVYLAIANRKSLAFCAFNLFNKLRAFNSDFSSSPTAPAISSLFLLR